MIDPVDLILAEDPADIAVQFQRRGQVVAERLFDHDATPGTIATVVGVDQTGSAQVFDDDRKVFW